MFTQNCFLRNAPKCLWSLVMDFGYTPKFLDWETRMTGKNLVLEGGGWYFTDSDNHPNSIDCGEDIALFLAIAPMRDDDDSYQWFVCEYDDEKEPTEDPSMFLCLSGIIEYHIHEYMDGWDVGHYRKATPEEIIRHFKNKKKNLEENK